MATIHVTLSSINKRGVSDTAFPVINSVPRAAKTLTSTASSVPEASISGANGEVWSVTAKGGDVYAAFGAAPVAAADSGHLILAGQTRDFAVTTAGEKIAVKDA